MTYKRTKNGYTARYGKKSIFLHKRSHGKFDGFPRSVHWYTATISLNGEIIASEGVFGSNLKTLAKAKTWVKSKL